VGLVVPYTPEMPITCLLISEEKYGTIIQTQKGGNHEAQGLPPGTPSVLSNTALTVSIWLLPVIMYRGSEVHCFQV